MSLELLIVKYLKICLIANMIINAICVGSGNKFECVVRNKCKYITCVAQRVGNCQWNSQKNLLPKTMQTIVYVQPKIMKELPSALRQFMLENGLSSAHVQIWCFWRSGKKFIWFTIWFSRIDYQCTFHKLIMLCFFVACVTRVQLHCNTTWTWPMFCWLSNVCKNNTKFS